MSVSPFPPESESDYLCIQNDLNNDTIKDLQNDNVTVVHIPDGDSYLDEQQARLSIHTEKRSEQAQQEQEAATRGSTDTPKETAPSSRDENEVPRPSPGATYAIIVLTAMNGLNYIDRYIPSSVKDPMKNSLGLTDTQTSLPLTGFIIVYMICCPIFSHFAYKGYSRIRLLTFGIILWSLSTVASAFVINFGTLMLARAVVGVGEAAYVTIAPPLICDFFPRAIRARYLSMFYLALPIGAALGYGLGAGIAALSNWRVSFLACGAPGLVAAFFVLRIKEPKLGVHDHHHNNHHEEDDDSNNRYNNTNSSNNHNDNDNGSTDDAKRIVEPFAISPSCPPESPPLSPLSATSSSSPPSPSPSSPPSWGATLRSLLNNPEYMYATIGLTFLTFGAGGMADWLPTYLERVYDVSLAFGGLAVGGVTVIAGIVGTVLGTYLGDKIRDSNMYKNSYLLVPGMGLGLAAACSVVVLIMPKVEGAVIFLLLTEIFLWFYIGPLNALSQNCVAPAIRTRASGIQGLMIHVLGDAISPTILGSVSDSTGSMRGTFTIIPCVFAMGALVWMVGWRRVKEPINPVQIKIAQRENVDQ